jgi:uncharacterized protein
MPSNRFPLTLLPRPFAVCRLHPAAPIPDVLLAVGGPLCSITRTDEELSIVCEEDHVPATALKVERGFRAFKLEGPVPFTTIGVVSGMTKPLAEAGISVFILSTYDTDYLLVNGQQVGRAATILGRAGFVVASSAPS